MRTAQYDNNFNMHARLEQDINNFLAVAPAPRCI